MTMIVEIIIRWNNYEKNAIICTNCRDNLIYKF